MLEGTPHSANNEQGFQPYVLIKPIEELGTFTYNPEEDEISDTKIKYENIKKRIEILLVRFEKEKERGRYNLWSPYRDAKGYLEKRLHEVDYTLERLSPKK